MKKIIFKYLLCAKHFVKHWRYKQRKQNSPYSQGVRILIGEESTEKRIVGWT